MALSAASKVRDWCFTTFEVMRKPQWDEQAMSFLGYQLEVCPETGKEHYQGYVEFRSPKTMSQVKTKFGDFSMHLEKRKGSPQQAADYASKEDTRKDGEEPFMYGSLKQSVGQGKRTDLDDLKRSIDDALTDGDLWDGNFGTMLKYHKAVQVYKDVKRSTRGRSGKLEDEPECIWYYGETGVGKSHKIFEDYDPETDYVWPNDGNWWDNYCGQEKVIINEFRGEIKYSTLLQLCDKWPVFVSRRNMQPHPFVAKTILISSHGDPETIYSGVKEKYDNINQLTRRFKVVHMEKDDDDGAVAPIFLPRSVRTND